MKGTNHEDTRRFNQAAVYEIVRKTGPISRVDIATKTGLRNQTITNITRELIEHGLMAETGKIQGKRGQPQTILEICGHAACSIGIQIDKGIMTARLVDLNMNTIAGQRLEMHSLEPAYVIDELADVITSLMARVPATQMLWGVGIALATLLDKRTPEDLLSPGWDSWKQFDLINALSQKVNIPIYVENDATAAAIGSRVSGQGKNLNNFVYLYIGNGIGAGLIVNGQPYKGTWNNAGEIGRIQWPHNGTLEYIEKLLSIPGLSRALECPESEVMMADYIEQLLASQSPRLTHWLKEASARLQFVINILENMLEPESIIIGSTLPNPLLHALLEHATPLSPSICAMPSRAYPRVMIAPQHHNIVASGAASIPIYAACHPKLHHLFSCSHTMPPSLVP